MSVVSVDVQDIQVLYTWQCPCTLKGVALHALYSSGCTYICKHMHIRYKAIEAKTKGQLVFNFIHLIQVQAKKKIATLNMKFFTLCYVYRRVDTKVVFTNSFHSYCTRIASFNISWLR